MRKIIKIPSDSLVSSDVQFDHKSKKLLFNRGFLDVDEYNRYLTEEFSAIPKDKVLVLCGDFASDTTQVKLREFLSKIKCKVYVLWGGYHGLLSTIYREAILDQYGSESLEIYPMVHRGYPNVTFIGDSAYFHVEGQDDLVFASHYPHYIWRYMASGCIHICGHGYGACSTTNGEDVGCGKIMDVGVEMAQSINDGKPYMQFSQVHEYCKAIPKKIK